VLDAASDSLSSSLALAVAATSGLEVGLGVGTGIAAALEAGFSLVADSLLDGSLLDDAVGCNALTAWGFAAAAVAFSSLSPPPDDSEYTVTNTARIATALKAMTQRLLCSGGSFSAGMSLKSTATGRVVLP
jgi:hypothetical protein